MISFIVPAHNEELLIGHTLAAIHVAAGETGEPYEVIVVDDASTDRTAVVAVEQGARLVTVDYRQIGRTRNAGARAARGDVFVVVDADTIVATPTLVATMAALRDGAAGGGASLRLEGRIPWHGRLLLLLVRASMRLGRFAAGCYLFATRAAFEAAGGFDDRLFATEEIALSRALARYGRVVVLRESVVSSGRKLRTHSGWEILGLIGAVARQGPRALRNRERLELWYGRRRSDPGPGTGPTERAADSTDRPDRPRRG